MEATVAFVIAGALAVLLFAGRDHLASLKK
jgi:hypothetical protein